MKISSAIFFLLGLAAALAFFDFDASAIAASFTANISGEPQISDHVTFVPGTNVTLNQSGHNITISTNTSGGTTNHAALTNLNWADAGHTFDADLDINNNRLIIGNADPIYATNGENIVVVKDLVLGGTPSIVRLETDSTAGNVFFGARFRGSIGGTVTPLQSGDILFRLGGIGTKGTNTYSGATSEIMFVAVTSSWTNTSTPAGIYFWTVPNGSTAQAIRGYANDSGYWGFNTAAPVAKLHSVGTARLAGLPAETSSYDAVCRDPATGDIYYASGLTTCLLSSEKVKENITYISKNQTAELMKLKPITYNEKKGNQTRYGLKAEDVAQVFPEAIGYYSYDTDDGEGNTTYVKTTNVTGINYEQIIPILIKVVQEQQKTIDFICSKNQTLCNGGVK